MIKALFSLIPVSGTGKSKSRRHHLMKKIS